MAIENPSMQEIIDVRGTAQAFGMPLTTAAERGYLIGPHLRHVSDSRVDFAEGQRLGEFFAPEKPLQVVSLFEGIGNTSTAFADALPGTKILAVESDPVVYECAQHNIREAGQRKNITLLQGDAVAVLKDTTTTGGCGIYGPSLEI